MKSLSPAKITLLVMASLSSTAIQASGFAIQEQSVTGLGRAFAGSAAVADDASTIFFNPAGLSYLQQDELALGLHYIAPQSDFNDNGSSIAPGLPVVGGTPLGGNDGSDAGQDALVPNLFYAKRINDRFVAGIGITAPFGLVTEYKDTWQGRYHAIRSDLKTININPSFAFKANDKLSVGMGFTVQYIDLELTQAVDFGSICANPPNMAPIPACIAPTNNDGQVKLEADDWGWGYNLGLIYQATDATRLGLSYRSKISHHLTGDGRFRIPDNAAALATTFADGRVTGDVDLPESASVAIHHQLNDKLAMSADATWTRWSRFEELVIESPDVAALNSTKPEEWDNTMRYAIGVDYQYSQQWTLRGGIAYDETPTSTEFRTARIPGEDRTWIAIGASYKYSDRLTLDAGYTHIFVKDPDIDESVESALNHRLLGEYEASIDILSVQARWYFQ